MGPDSLWLDFLLPRTHEQAGSRAFRVHFEVGRYGCGTVEYPDRDSRDEVREEVELPLPPIPTVFSLLVAPSMGCRIEYSTWVLGCPLRLLMADVEWWLQLYGQCPDRWTGPLWVLGLSCGVWVGAQICPALGAGYNGNEPWVTGCLHSSASGGHQEGPGGGKGGLGFGVEPAQAQGTYILLLMLEVQVERYPLCPGARQVALPGLSSGLQPEGAGFLSHPRSSSLPHCGGPPGGPYL